MARLQAAFAAAARGGDHYEVLGGRGLLLIDSISYLLLATDLDREVVQSYLATLGTPNQLLQLTVCCSQAQLETSAKPASKAGAKRVWTAADKSNKLKVEEPAASSAPSASATASDRAPIEEKAQDTAKSDKKLWADEPVDPRYIGQDIDLATLTEEQIPELKRRAAWLRRIMRELCKRSASG